MKEIMKQVEEQIKMIGENGIDNTNIEYLCKLIDIHKDIKNEEYWDIKEENYMRYRGYSEGGYGNYGRRGVKGTGRGRRYREGGYGAGNYGDDKEETLEMMKEHYQGYSESSMYGAEGESMEALNGMLEAAYEFVSMLSEDAKSQEEAELVKKWSRKIGQL